MKFSFKIENKTGQDQIIHLEEKDITIGNDNSIIFLDANDGPSTWVSFEQNDFILSVGQSQEITAKIAVPDGQENGEEMMTMVSFSSPDISLDGGPKVSGSIGVYTLLSGMNTSNADGNIKNISYPKLISKSSNVDVVYENNGDVQFVPQARISIANLLTKERVEFPFENHFVFPEKSFTFKKSLAEFSEFWIYEIKVSFKDGNGKLLEKTGYAVGLFFPIISLLLISLGFYLGKKLLEIRKRNAKN
jgi:hypothetical protein